MTLSLYLPLTFTDGPEEGSYLQLSLYFIVNYLYPTYFFRVKVEGGWGFFYIVMTLENYVINDLWITINIVELTYVMIKQKLVTEILFFLQKHVIIIETLLLYFQKFSKVSALNH